MIDLSTQPLGERTLFPLGVRSATGGMCDHQNTHPVEAVLTLCLRSCNCGSPVFKALLLVPSSGNKEKFLLPNRPDLTLTLAASGARVPSVPTTAYQFQADCRRLSAHPEKFYEYFKVSAAYNLRTHKSCTYPECH